MLYSGMSLPLRYSYSEMTVHTDVLCVCRGPEYPDHVTLQACQHCLIEDKRGLWAQMLGCTRESTVIYCAMSPVGILISREQWEIEVQEDYLSSPKTPGFS